MQGGAAEVNSQSTLACRMSCGTGGGDGPVCGTGCGTWNSKHTISRAVGQQATHQQTYSRGAASTAALISYSHTSCCQPSCPYWHTAQAYQLSRLWHLLLMPLAVPQHCSCFQLFVQAGQHVQPQTTACMAACSAALAGPITPSQIDSTTGSPALHY